MTNGAKWARNMISLITHQYILNRTLSQAFRKHNILVITTHSITNCQKKLTVTTSQKNTKLFNHLLKCLKIIYKKHIILKF